MALNIQRRPGTVGKSSGDAKRKPDTPKVIVPPLEQEHVNHDDVKKIKVDGVTVIDKKESQCTSDNGKWRKPTCPEGQTGATAQVAFNSSTKKIYKGPPVAHVMNIRKAELNKIGIKDLEQWVKDPKNVYIGRDMTCYVKGAIGSKWHNPFKSKKLGRDESVRLFTEHIRATPSLMADLDELKGKRLGCWCHPLSCHGHALVRLLEEKTANEQLK